MIYGCGVDIEKISRFDKFLQKSLSSSPFSLIFTEQELKNYKLYDESLCLTLGFSCKEAFFKAFGKSWVNSNIDWKDIELIFSDNPLKKAFAINFYGDAKKIVKKKSIITPSKSDYTVFSDYVVFETILLCSKK